MFAPSQNGRREGNAFPVAAVVLENTNRGLEIARFKFWLTTPSIQDLHLPSIVNGAKDMGAHEYLTSLPDGYPIGVRLCLPT